MFFTERLGNTVLLNYCIDSNKFCSTIKTTSKYTRGLRTGDEVCDPRLPCFTREDGETDRTGFWREGHIENSYFVIGSPDLPARKGRFHQVGPYATSGRTVSRRGRRPSQ